MPTVLIVDDEHGSRESLERIFEKAEFRALSAPSATRALEICRERKVDVVLTDLMMPGVSGLEFTRALKSIAPDVEVVVMTAYATVETAVECMREGAYDFVEKPLKRMAIVKTVRKAAERRALVAENRTLKAELSGLRSREIIGHSQALRAALDVARQAALSSATVLILGESGTGKELLARQIHAESGRKGAFVAVNLAALPEGILESELFGHERGAFTGAVQRREGRLAQASGGTLFLDEVGELPASVQVKLLRVLQESEFEPLGGKTMRVDLRLVAATHRDLRAAVEAGTFREDLYYRLNVISITAPPLRDRREDIPLLVDHFLETYARKNDKTPLRVTREAMDKLMAYPFPGNVRELENVIERAVVLSRTELLEVADLPSHVTETEHLVDRLVFPIGTPLHEIERQAIQKTLAHTGGDKQLAAQLLGISARTIYRKLDSTEARGDYD
jgi:DNA-binding NtrC family response regulator